MSFFSDFYSVKLGFAAFTSNGQFTFIIRGKWNEHYAGTDYETHNRNGLLRLIFYMFLLRHECENGKAKNSPNLHTVHEIWFITKWQHWIWKWIKITPKNVLMTVHNVLQNEGSCKSWNKDWCEIAVRGV